MLEALLLQHARIHVVLEMVVIERDPQAVHPDGRKERSVLVHEEVLEPPVEEILILLRPEDLEHRRAVLVLLSGIAGDEILHAAHTYQQGLQSAQGETDFIHPPSPAPRRITSFPAPSTTRSPCTLRNEYSGAAISVLFVCFVCLAAVITGDDIYIYRRLDGHGRRHNNCGAGWGRFQAKWDRPASDPPAAGIRGHRENGYLRRLSALHQARETRKYGLYSKPRSNRTGRQLYS